MRRDPESDRDVPRHFYVGIGWLILAVVQLGFLRNYWIPVASGADVPLIIHVHAFTLFGWTGLFLLQAHLVARGSTRLHRRVGLFGVAWALVTIALAFRLAVVTIARDLDRIDGTFRAVGTLIPLTQVSMFTVLVAAALLQTRRVEVHKRLMVLAATVVATPAVARIGMLVFGESGPGLVAFVFLVTNGAIVALAWYDRARTGRLHPIYLWGGLAIVTVRIVRVKLAMSEPWRDFAHWLAALA